MNQSITLSMDNDGATSQVMGLPRKKGYRPTKDVDSQKIDDDIQVSYGLVLLSLRHPVLEQI